MEGGNFLVSTRINLKKHEIKEIILKIQKTEKSNFIFISRKEETEKNPYSFFLELNINYNDALEVIKEGVYYGYLVESPNGILIQ